MVIILGDRVVRRYITNGDCTKGSGFGNFFGKVKSASMIKPQGSLCPFWSGDRNYYFFY